VEYGVNERGFNKKTFEEIVADQKARARNLFGNDINLEDDSPLGKYIKLNAFETALAWDMAEEVYNSAYIFSVSGQQLDNFVARNGISRKEPTVSIGSATFNGDQDTVIPIGTKIETDTDPAIQFKTTESGTIDSTGSITLNIESIEKGAHTRVAANTITVITNPISGLDSVTNSSATEGGQDRETDYRLRLRYLDSVNKPGGSTTDSILANVLEVDGVRAAKVIENDSFSTVDNIPPKAIETVVLGGIGEEIAKAILEKKAGGIKAYGTDETYTLQDDSGQDKIIKLSRAIEEQIYVTVDLTNVDDSKFPSDGKTQVQDAVINYIGGADSQGEILLGLSLGGDVIYNKCIDTAMSIPGVEDLNLTIDTVSPPSGTSNITIGTRYVATTDADKVVVNIV